MKAIVYERYGSPDVLNIAEVEKPVATGHQVLIKVRAAAVNPADCGCMDGTVRFMTGLFKPKFNRLGLDVAGEVLAVGDKVTQFKPGDEVFGACVINAYDQRRTVWRYNFGSFAEYALSHEGALALKPKNLSFEQAASVACTAWTAIQGLRTFGKIQPGQKVLISSATGGVGTFAVQIAKALGAEVTGVCSTKNIELVRSLGADNVVDYTKEDYTKQGRRYDLIFDSIGEHSMLALGRILNPSGKIVFVGIRDVKPTSPAFLGRFLLAKALPNAVSNGSRPNQKDLIFLSNLLSTGKIKPVIQKQFNGLAEVPQAVQHVKEGRAWGKVVVTV